MIFEFNIKFWAKIAQKKPLGDVSTASKRHREVSKTYFFSTFFHHFWKMAGLQRVNKKTKFPVFAPNEVIFRLQYMFVTGRED